ALHLWAADAAREVAVRGVPGGRERAHDRAGELMSPPLGPARAATSRQRSQALIEFALVSPVLLLLLFGVVDIGRAIFYYDTLNHAAREGARVAVRASNQLPTNSDVLGTVNSQMLGTPVTAPCPQGPVTGATPPDTSAWLDITEPNPPGTVEAA